MTVYVVKTCCTVLSVVPAKSGSWHAKSTHQSASALRETGGLANWKPTPVKRTHQVVRSLAVMKGSTGSFPVLKDLVLLGGGHAHVEVLRSFGMGPMPGVRLTLITKDVHTAYSGMLPGFVAQYYTFDECHVDLARLATFAKAQFVHATATSIDPQAQTVQLEGREPISYDVLSIDVGITPSGQGIPGALEFATPVKPVSSFVKRLDKIKQRHAASQQQLKVAVVGGGAGGVELALSLHHFLGLPRRDAGPTPTSSPAQVTILARSKILASHPAAARTKFLRIMKEKGLTVLEGTAVKKVEQGKLSLAGGEVLEFDECLWCTQAGAPAWLGSTGLPLDDKGFVAISATLQCSGGPANVFAVGDVASSAAHPRPKAGVFAVRQGPPLTANLRKFLEGQPLEPFKPQTNFLSLITTGDRYAIATKGWIVLEGGYLWNWKDKIDRTWMDQYGRTLPEMGAQPPQSSEVAQAAGPEARAVVAAAHMRCGGCGAKVGASVLSRALAKLPKGAVSDDIIIGLGARDDAAVVRPPPPGHVLVQTVDFFRSFVSDPYEFGAIAANNALGDCHAMGAQPQTALAIAVVPFGTDAKVEGTLYQMMAGALKVLTAAGCSLVGGHTCEGDEAALGFAVNGVAPEGELLRKSGARPGQALILTKPLGTGVLMAASMRNKAKGRWVAGAVACMQQSGQAACGCLKAAGASACTDVTGFGLLGHLQEIALASEVRVALDIEQIPLLDGAAECAAAGVASSLAPQNSRVAAWIAHAKTAARHPKWPLLLDPQTGGGLLATVPSENAAACVDQLQQLGYKDAAVIGQIQELQQQAAVLPTEPALLIQVHH